MILVRGECCGDIWHGHNGRCLLFIPSRRLTHYNTYVRESHGRSVRNVVAWDSITGIAEGHWSSISTWVKAT
ncbi:hypothetical protein pdam_00021003 [Pocillopora damicornis]|uniref:Uncharacterized protein n=1 Tax=Pocillopora damicornis TaxID=46731 RepID=A0A3M6U0A8_POCDA|nr:hypothetical protein pdam_00021003 [Pocillopora damicornis]